MIALSSAASLGEQGLEEESYVTSPRWQQECGVWPLCTQLLFSLPSGWEGQGCPASELFEELPGDMDCEIPRLI